MRRCGRCASQGGALRAYRPDSGAAGTREAGADNLIGIPEPDGPARLEPLALPGTVCSRPCLRTVRTIGSGSTLAAGTGGDVDQRLPPFGIPYTRSTRNRSTSLPSRTIAVRKSAQSGCSPRTSR